MSRKQQCSSAVTGSMVLGASLVAGMVAFVAGEGSAAAQGRFGDKGSLVISAENLFSLSTERRAEAQPTGDNVDTINRLGFLFTSRSDGFGGNNFASPYDPAIGAHYFIIPNLSIGGSFGYESRGGSFSAAPRTPAGTITISKPDVAAFEFLPKVGYSLMLSNVLGFWFRGGPGFTRIGASDSGNPTQKESWSFWLLAVDAFLVVSPVPHFGFYVGPQGDLSFAGSHSVTNAMGVTLSNNASHRGLGIGTGLYGYFDL